MEKIGIIGAGIMGSGLAALFSCYGFEVRLIDSDESALESSKELIKKNKILTMFRKKDMQDKECILANTITELNDCKFIIEAITEDIEKKLELYSNLRTLSNKEQIIISNTSCIPISRLGLSYEDDKRVIGVHFMNPVSIVEAVEIIKGKNTSEETIEEVCNLLKKIEKKYFIVNDSAGFVSNRVSHLYMNEAAYLVQENVADISSIDGIFKKCYGHKMGPLETADLIGIDVVVNSLKVLYSELKQDKFLSCPLLIEMVKNNQLGRKTGKGFYTY